MLVGDLPAGAVGAEHGQACGGCRVGCGGSGQPEQGQLVLDRDDGCPNRGQGLRRGDLGSAGEVDRADERAGFRVVNGHRGAAPRLNNPGKVLRASDLQSLSRASAVPGALVPAPRSLQSAPGTKFIASALRHTLGSPSTHSSVPSAADTATTTPASVASSTSSRRITGSADASGWAARIRPRSTPPRRTALPRDPDRRPWPGCAASFRPPPAAAGVGSVHLAGNKEVVNGAQRRRRQPGRGPAARVLRDTHRRSRSSRAGALTCCFPRARPSRVAATIAQLWRDAYP